MAKLVASATTRAKCHNQIINECASEEISKRKRKHGNRNSSSEAGHQSGIELKQPNQAPILIPGNKKEV
jgi:hypothetical protein